MAQSFAQIPCKRFVLRGIDTRLEKSGYFSECFPGTLFQVHFEEECGAEENFLCLWHL